MRNNEYEKAFFDKEELFDVIKIWRYTAVDLVDIRYQLINSEKSLRNYRIPTNMFLYTSGGRTEVILDNTSYVVERFGIFHGGKGTELSIKPMCKWVEYYMILYRAGEPPFYRREFTKLLEKRDPFKQQYGFAPNNPIFFSEQLRRMFERWKKPDPLDLFYEKTLFYQLAYEVYREIERENTTILAPDPIITAKKYMDENYGQEISLQLLCNSLNISRSHFHKMFTEYTGKSPQEYLIRIRLEAVKKYLLQTEYTLKEIALICGFSDEFTLMKMFRKYFKMTTKEYKDIGTYDLGHKAMENDRSFPYTEKSQVRLNKLNVEGEFFMFKQVKYKTVIAMTLSLILLLTACTSVGTSSQEQGQSVKVQEQEIEVEKETRTIQMDYGDVEIPANPKRVIVAFMQGDLLALGITPVGTSFNDDAVFMDVLKDVTVIDAFDVNKEEIMALDPDLIIWNNPDAYEDLSKIAPTLATNYYSMDYKERLRFFGEVFGLSEKAEQLIEDFESKVEESKKRLADAGLMDKTVILLENRQNGVLRAFGNSYGRGGELIYNYIGLPASERIQKEIIDKEDVKFIDISYEVLKEYSADYIFSDENVRELSDNAVWTSLPAVKKGRLVETSSGMFWFSDITSMNAQLDFILDTILKSGETFK